MRYLCPFINFLLPFIKNKYKYFWIRGKNCYVCSEFQVKLKFILYQPPRYHRTYFLRCVISICTLKLWIPLKKQVSYYEFKCGYYGIMVFRLFKIAIFFLLIVSSNYVSAQDNQKTLKIEFLNKSDETLDKPIHYHLLKVTNNSSIQQEFVLDINTVSCKNINLSNQVNLIIQIYSKDLSNELKKIVLNPKGIKEFYVKTSQPNNIKLDTWSCLEITALSLSNKIESNSILIKSSIIDPDNVN